MALFQCISSAIGQKRRAKWTLQCIRLKFWKLNHYTLSIRHFPFLYSLGEKAIRKSPKKEMISCETHDSSPSTGEGRGEIGGCRKEMAGWAAITENKGFGSFGQKEQKVVVRLIVGVSPVIPF
jgi:hypothetical protein